MATWIETSNKHQNGEPVTRRIRTDQLSDDIWFTTNGYAEIADDNVADILATEIGSLSKVSEPADPGTYYGDASESATIRIVLENGNFDALTAESGNIDSLDTEVAGINQTQVSGRMGGAVYYDPGNRGPYLDGADALANVPPGGSLIISARNDYDVAVEGRLAFSDGITIQGEGWTTDANNNLSGTKIVNTGSDVIDQPVIDFDAAERENRGINVRNLSIFHEGGTTPAIRVNNAIRNTVADCMIDMGLVGHTGIKATGSSFFTRVYRTHSVRFTEYGIHMDGGIGGGGDSIVDCHSGSSVTDSVATRIERQGDRIVGGQHSADGAGISFHNTYSATLRGGWVGGQIWFEHCTDGIRVDGDAHPFNDIVISNPRASLYTAGGGVDNLINIGQSTDTQVLYPVLFSVNGGGNLATLGANSQRPLFVGDYSNIGPPPIVDNGSDMPTRIIQDSLTEAYFSSIDTTIPVWVALRRGANGSWSPAFYDGSGWFEQSSANTEFIP